MASHVYMNFPFGISDLIHIRSQPKKIKSARTNRNTYALTKAHERMRKSERISRHAHTKHVFIVTVVYLFCMSWSEFQGCRCSHVFGSQHASKVVLDFS